MHLPKLLVRRAHAWPTHAGSSKGVLLVRGAGAGREDAVRMRCGAQVGGSEVHLERNGAPRTRSCATHAHGSGPSAVGGAAAAPRRQEGRVISWSQNSGRSVVAAAAAASSAQPASSGSSQFGPACVRGQLHSPVTRLQVPRQSAQFVPAPSTGINMIVYSHFALLTCFSRALEGEMRQTDRRTQTLAS